MILPATILFHLFMSAVNFAAFYFLLKTNKGNVFVVVIIWALASIALVLWLGENTFGFLRLTAYSVFVHAPLMILILGFSFRERSAAWYRIAILIALLISLTGIYAFFIEPHDLQITQYILKSNKIQDAIKIAVISDLQADKIGEYERNIFRIVLAKRPDLILMTGDYLQPLYVKDGIPLMNDFKTYLQSIHLFAKYGVYAVRGDTEGPNWQELFINLPIRTFEQSDSFQIGEIYFTALSRSDSRNTHLRVKQRDLYHIVFGHSPDYSLGQVNADLLIAGHTHGGQVRFPGIGPLFILSKIPRSWSAGITNLDENRRLLVSKGIGMERGFAPQLRLFCRPEIVFLSLIPT